MFRQDFPDFTGLTGSGFCDWNLNDFVGKVKEKLFKLQLREISVRKKI